MTRKRAFTVLVFGWIILQIVGFTYAHNNGMKIVGFDLGVDLGVYQDGARALLNGGEVYDLAPGTMATHLSYRYHPAFLLPVIALLQLPVNAQIFVWYVLIAAGYIAGVLLWLRLLRQMGFQFWHYLPLFIFMAYDWHGNLAYGNAGPVLVLLSGGLLWAVTRQKLGVTALLATLILVIKPQWCFPLLYALAMKQDRWFVKAAALSILGYAAASALFVVLTGRLDVLRDYYQFVFTLQARYPWHGTDVMFNTIQNSLYQTFLRYGFPAGIASPGTLLIQIGLLALLAVMIWRVRRSPDTQRALIVTLGGYIVAMCLLPQLEEGLLAGIIAATLWTSRRSTRAYLVYSLFDLAAFAAAVTGIQALYVYMTFPMSLIMLIILYEGVVTTILFNRQAQPVSPAYVEARQT